MSKRQITSFSIDWYRCGLCNPLDKVHEKTTVYLRKRIIKIEKFNGLNELLGKEEYFVPGNHVHNFFDCINKMDLNNTWEKDYSVPVCDGATWEMRLRYSDRTIKLIVGTVEKPDKGQEIESMIEDMLVRAKCIESPMLFGC